MPSVFVVTWKLARGRLRASGTSLTWTSCRRKHYYFQHPKLVHDSYMLLKLSYSFSRWPEHLKKGGYKVSTIKNILTNVKAFLTHVNLFHKKESRLTLSNIGQLIDCIKRMQSDIMREVVVHRQKVKRVKSRKFYYTSS